MALNLKAAEDTYLKYWHDFFFFFSQQSIVHFKTWIAYFRQ